MQRDNNNIDISLELDTSQKPELISYPRTLETDPASFVTDVFKDIDKLFEVTSAKLFSNKRPDPKGLLSEQGFGPCKDYKCWCKYWGPSVSSDENRIVRCKRCGIEITTSSKRRTTWGKITLAVPIIDPLLIIFLMTEPFFKSIKIDLIARGIFGLDYDPSDKSLIEQEEPIDHATLEQILMQIADDYDISIIRAFFEYKKTLLCRHVLVIPPDYRPATLKTRDIINNRYENIINYNNLVRNLDIVLNDSQVAGHLFQLVYELYIESINRYAHKQDIIRKHVLGKRIDFSGRAVIIPNPYKLDEVGLPLEIAKELYKLPAARKIVNEGRASSYIDAINKLMNEPEKYIDILEHVMKDTTILLNRQPTLHRCSILGFTPKLTQENAIRLPAIVCDPFGSDFDGDSVFGNVNLLIDDEIMLEDIPLSELEQLTVQKI